MFLASFKLLGMVVRKLLCLDLDWILVVPVP